MSERLVARPDIAATAARRFMLSEARIIPHAVTRRATRTDRT